MQVDKSAEFGNGLFVFRRKFRLLPCRIWLSYTTNPLLVLARYIPIPHLSKFYTAFQLR